MHHTQNVWLRTAKYIVLSQQWCNLVIVLAALTRNSQMAIQHCGPAVLHGLQSSLQKEALHSEENRVDENASTLHMQLRTEGCEEAVLSSHAEDSDEATKFQHFWAREMWVNITRKLCERNGVCWQSLYRRTQRGGKKRPRGSKRSKRGR